MVPCLIEFYCVLLGLNVCKWVWARTRSLLLAFLDVPSITSWNAKFFSLFFCSSSVDTFVVVDWRCVLVVGFVGGRGRASGAGQHRRRRRDMRRRGADARRRRRWAPPGRRSGNAHSTSTFDVIDEDFLLGLVIEFVPLLISSFRILIFFHY